MVITVAVRMSWIINCLKRVGFFWGTDSHSMIITVARWILQSQNPQCLTWITEVTTKMETSQEASQYSRIRRSQNVPHFPLTNDTSVSTGKVSVSSPDWAVSKHTPVNIDASHQKRKQPTIVPGNARAGVYTPGAVWSIPNWNTRAVYRRKEQTECPLQKTVQQLREGRKSNNIVLLLLFLCVCVFVVVVV